MLKSLDLNGAWKIRYTDGQRGKRDSGEGPIVDPALWLDAVVPGEIHLDLMRAGLIGDVARDLNFLSARWIEEYLWTYRRDFDAPAEALRGRAWLVFDALDLVATVYLNGGEIARHANVFYPCRVDVTGKLRAGTNHLAVQIESGLFD